MSRSSTHHHRVRKHRQAKVDTHQIDRATYAVAIIEPFLTIPQIYAIWSTKDASGVSVSSWTGYLLFGGIWLYYGIVHKDRAIILYQVLYLITEVLIIVGALMYGGHW